MRHAIVPKSIGLSVRLAIGLVLASLIAVPSAPAVAREGNKTLKLYFGHTKERGEFTFKRNGRYDKKELARINRFLRDWRRNEPAKMDPQLLDLVWSVYQEAGGRDYIHVVSAYRSPATNAMLRGKSSGVAEKSQHMVGKAMDFYIPGVKLDKLRAIAMKHQSGGVGYYPRSGSPFVHLDTGNVRAWPRMSRQQLIALFPDGDTLHLPADGKPLPGYERALARGKSSGGTALAYLETGTDGNERVGGNAGGWLKRMFSGGADEAEDNEVTAAPPAAEPGPAAPAPEPAIGEPQMLIAEQALPEPRLPRARPANASEMMVASVSPQTPEAALAPYEGEALTSLAFAPLPKSRPDSELLAASLDRAAAAPASLEVEPEDAIAALAARSEADLPAPPAAAPVQMALLAPKAAAPSSPDDQAAIDAFAAIDDATSAPAGAEGGVPVPRPRPVALAFAGSGLPHVDVAVPPAPAAEPPAVQAAMAEPTQASLESIPAAPAPVVESSQLPAPAVPDEPRVMRDAAAAPKGDFGGFAMPRPAATPELFVAPATAASVGIPDPRLPADRFQAAQPEPTPAPEESFFSRLFANLAG